MQKLFFDKLPAGLIYARFNSLPKKNVYAFFVDIFHEADPLIKEAKLSKN